MSESEAAARDEFFESLLGDFLDESGQLLDRLNEKLLQLDEWVRSLEDCHQQRCDEDLLNEMFRSAHSLKGLSAMLGLTDINTLTHKVENVFDAARKEELIISGDVVELMFQAVDRLVSLVDALKDPDSEAVECESVIEGIGSVLQAAGAERKQSTQADAENALIDDTSETDAEATAESRTAGAAEPADAPPADDGAPSAVAGSAPPIDAGAATHGAEADSIQPEAASRDLFDGIQDESELPAKYVGIFIDESELSLDSLTETLLASEGDAGRATIEKLLITSHRIKGSAASIGLNRAAKLAHLMEDLLQDLLEHDRTLSAEMTDAMLRCTDALRQYVHDLRQGAPRSDHFVQLAAELVSAQQAGESASPPQPPPLDGSDPTAAPGAPAAPPSTKPPAGLTGISAELKAAVGSAAPPGSPAVAGELAFEPKLTLVGLKARLVYEKLSNLGDVCYFDPPAETLDELEDLGGVTFGLVTEKPLVKIYNHLRIAGVQRVFMEPLDEPASTETSAPEEKAAAAPPAASGDKGLPGASPPGASAARSGAAREAAVPDGGSRPAETLRVDIDRLDQLMNLAGQLVISKARFTRIGDSLKTALSSKQTSQVLDGALGMLERLGAKELNPESPNLQTELEALRAAARRVQAELEQVRQEVRALADARLTVNDLGEAIHQLDRVTDGIQQSVMDTRMVPIGPLFARFKRVIRDITRSNGKSVRLVINGEKTELDKRMIDELGDPLIHMVRNSVDHGIEMPEVREAAGKPRQGTVTLDAFHRGNSIVIRVSDDGKGLDPERILRKAIEKGLVSEADADKLSPHQVYQLIWEPGFSTAEKVTEVSGRGMGMDIVKSKISDLNGTIDTESTPGEGTTMTIKLPLTLAILPSLMTEIDGDVFALPVESVAEIVSVQREDMSSIHGLWTARVRGSVISVVDLSDVFSWSQGHRRARGGDSGETSLVIVGETGGQIGLIVDRVLGEEDIVIKSMAENYRNVPGIAGASILGDGRVSLILDVGALLEMASGHASAASL